MTMRKHAIRILVVALPLCAGASASTAISDSSLDDQADSAKASASVPSNWSEPAVTVVEVTIPPSAPPAPAAPAERALSANPLWAMPLKQFSVTRERPIFLPSRRPPAAVSAVTVSKAVVPPKPKEPEQPQLSLVGTISSDEDKFGIFVDQSTKAVVRLRLGDEFQGWKLQSVQGRDASLEKNQQTAVLSMPRIGLSQPSVAVRSEVPIGSDDGKLLPVTARPRNR
jgi:general secretion pathway protein N